MKNDARLNALVAVISAVTAVGFVFLQRWLDLSPAVPWAVIAFLIATLIWRLRHRSPYRDRKDDLHLR
jgi:hypothetical protein